ncbi:MAG: glycosyltransferase family 2 protein [Muribaculum sp.]|nr:glycosyltransferase family 2 protein [Muribaculum sp.]
MSYSGEVFLTFIVPLFNCEKYIERCINSLVAANRGREDLEIIVINDGSSDNGEQICSKYENDYSFIHLYNQTNKGASTARNLGLSRAKGKYVWFVDADDLISIDNFASIYNYLKDNHPDILTFNYYEEATLGLVSRISISEHSIQSATDFLKKCNRLYLWDKIYSKSIIGQTKFLDGTKNIEDFFFNIEVLIKDCQIHKINSFGYIYNTTNNASTSRNRSKKNLLKISSDSFRIHLKMSQLLSAVSIDKHGILEDLLYFGIGGHLYSILRFYNCRYLFKAIKYYKEYNLYPLKKTSNIKMNAFILVVNRLWSFRFLAKFQ